MGIILNPFCLIRVFGFESELQAWQGGEYFLQWRHLCGAGASHFCLPFFIFNGDTYMGHFPQDGENERNVSFFSFFSFI